jgi:hypothetical protein
MKRIGILLCCLLCGNSIAQTRFVNAKSIDVQLEKDSIQFSKVSIHPVGFEVRAQQKKIDPKNYLVDFEKALLYIDHLKYPNISIHFTAYPEFLTNTYTALDKNRIVESPTKTDQLFRLSNRKTSDYKPFKGLDTQGSLVRGLAIGNNQDAVMNSSLDLQLSGKLSEKVTLNASISDSNIPIQENGYSQNIEEFDRVFIEIFSDNWAVKAGDVEISNTETHFLKFEKKVSGLRVKTQLGEPDKKTEIQASGALVRGQFRRQQFQGEEGNQGPYQLFGANGVSGITILSGSETVYINGIPIQRGEQNQYTIDYNRAEITFTTTHPITAQMRIGVEFQYSDRNYTRFVTYDQATYQTEKLQVGGYFYNENDAKNQPLQQNLTQEQKTILADAGNDAEKMLAPSAHPMPYKEDRILYKKEERDGNVVYLHTQDASEALYSVAFQFVGEGQGAYEMETATAVGKIYKFVGVLKGDYLPITRLVAPEKLQIAVATVRYAPHKKTSFHSEIAYSNRDKNLFSSIDDQNNKGLASKIGWTQTYLDKKWSLQSRVDFDYLQENFQSVQRIYNFEFSRDWNLENPVGNQAYLRTKLWGSNKKKKRFSYGFESLKFGTSFKGNRHRFETHLQIDKTKIDGNIQLLENRSPSEKGSFKRAQLQVRQSLGKTWIEATVDSEDILRIESASGEKNPSSNQFLETGAHWGIGDSTRVYTKIGIKMQLNDSIRNQKMTRVHRSKNYYLQSKWIKNKNALLSVYANYRTVESRDFENYNAVNTRLNYSQNLFENFVQWNSLYESASGTSPQQEFTYQKTEAGQGYYTWQDYNNNQIQEFEEFEIAQFSDQATYLRVALPSRNSVRTNRTKFSQSLNLNASQWATKSGFQKFMSQFSNLAYLLIDRKKKRMGNGFDLNPFKAEEKDLLALQHQLKNSLFFRRGQQKFTSTYTFSQSRTKNNLGIGMQESARRLQEIQFVHRLAPSWRIDVFAKRQKNENNAENYPERNYQINSEELGPSLTFNPEKNSNFSVNYAYKSKREGGGMSSLEVQQLGASYQHNRPEKGSLRAQLNFYQNRFVGNENTPVAYQMLEGLRSGNNFVWELIFQKKLSRTLDLNFLYSGRKSEFSKTLHTGNVQMRANF